MILEKQTENLVIEDGEIQQSTKMEIDIDSADFIMKMLSKFYSDPIGSLIRETASNALDSHRTAKVDEPIIVSISISEFSVEDFGTGIDANDVENILKKYGKSTKRDDPNALGAFGLGFKSPMAYSNSFYFIGRKNGVERKYMMFESEDGGNKIDLLYESATTERNGVKVIVPIKSYDYSTFVAKAKNQLAYFESVYFNCSNIDNNFKIIREKEYQSSELCADSSLHITLDNVYYPIDFTQLGISRINIPIALRFSLTDGVYPIPNREQLKYTKDTKEKILKKIEILATLLVEEYNKNIKDVDSLDNIVRHFTMYRIVKIGKHNVDLEEIKKFSKVKVQDPKFKGVNVLSSEQIYKLRDYFLVGYEADYRLKNRKLTYIKESYSRRLYYNTLQNTQSYITMNELPRGNYRTYLGQHIFSNTRNGLVIRKMSNVPLKAKFNLAGNCVDYYTILNLRNYSKGKWRQVIKDFITVRDSYIKTFTDISNVQIPDSWFEERKKERIEKMKAKGTHIKRQKLQGEINIKLSEPLNRYTGGNCKFENKVIDLKVAHKTPYLTVFCKSEHKEFADSLYNVAGKQKIKFGVVSEREYKKLKEIDLHNLISIDKFMEQKHIAFRRIITAKLISSLIKNNSHVFDNRNEILDELMFSFAKKIENLSDYVNKYYSSHVPDSVFKPLLEVAEEGKLYDYSIYGEYLEVKKMLETNSFINLVMGIARYSSKEEVFPIFRDLCRYHKLKMDYKHYVAEPKNDEIVVEEEQNEEQQIQII